MPRDQSLRTRSPTLLTGAGRRATISAVDRLWAPWRGAYVTDASPRGGCFLCAAAAGAEHQLVVASDGSTVTMLNRYPYNTGHLMVAPREHVPDLLAIGDLGAAAPMVSARGGGRAGQESGRAQGRTP